MRKMFLLIFSIMFIMACGHTGVKPEDWGQYYDNKVKPSMKSGKFWETCNKLVESKDYEGAKIQRNIQISQVVTGINAFYSDYKSNLLLNKSTLDTGFDIAQLTISALGTYFTDADLLQRLALSSAILTGSKTAFDKNFLQNQGIIVLIERMDRLRAEQIEKINANKEKAYDKWTLDDGLDDSAKLFDLGTVVGALLSINNDNTK